MVKLNTLVGFLNKELKVRSIKDPWCNNGLQVRGSDEIRKVGLSTDACMNVFKKAKDLDCDLVITHHGLFSKTIGKYDKIVSLSKARFLKESKMSLYSVHLPLDKNRKYGNNVTLSKMINAKTKESFASVGYIGYLDKPISLDNLAGTLKRNLKSSCKVYRFGKVSGIKKVAISSGYGGGDVNEAIAKRVDVFITGEISHGGFVKLRDSKMSVIAAGHYASETIGVKEVGKLLKKNFNLKTIFIDAPTGM